MRNFSTKFIKRTCEDAVKLDSPTEDVWLDNRYDEQRKFCGGLTLPYYRAAYRIAQHLKPRLVVELGTFQATWSAHIASAVPTCDVITIDIHKDPGQDIDAMLANEAAGVYENLMPLIGWTWDDHIIEIVKRFAEQTPIDILYIDAWHRRDYVEREWELYSPMLADRALVVCDDITNNGGMFEDMEEWWNDIPYEKYLDGAIHRGVPQGFFVYKRGEHDWWK